MRKVSVLTNDKELVNVVEQVLKPQCLVKVFSQAGKMFEYLQEKTADLVIIDTDTDNSKTIEYFKTVKRINPHIKVMIITALQDIDHAVRMTKLGVDDYLNKPIDINKLKLSTEKIFLSLLDISSLVFDKESKNYWIGSSQVLNDFLIFLKEAIKSEKNILLISEKGCLAEQVASVINLNKYHGKKRLVDINLSVFEKESSEVIFWNSINHLLDENATEGTIFIYGIKNLPQHFKENIIDFLIGKKTIAHDLQSKIVLSISQNEDLSNEHLDKLKGSVYELKIPSLRERKEDILFISNELLRKYSDRYGKNIRSIAKEVINLMLYYDWPGNYDELENFIEACVVRSKGECVMSYDAPINLQMIINSSLRKALHNDNYHLMAANKIFKDDIVTYLMECSNNNIEAVAKFLDCPKEIIDT